MGVEFDARERVAGVTLEVLALPEDGAERDDDRVLLVLEPVGRLAVSVRHGPSNDRRARVERFDVGELESVLPPLLGHAIYGWSFFDAPEKAFRTWSGRLSLDWHADAPGGRAHSLELFQEAFVDDEERHLDLRIWFDELRILRPDHSEVPVDVFVAEGRRWWEAFGAQDPRTAGRGLVPLRSSLSVRALGWLLRLTPWRKGGEF